MSDVSTDTSMENILNSIKQIIAEDDTKRLQVMKETEEYYNQNRQEENNDIPPSSSAMSSLPQDEVALHVESSSVSLGHDSVQGAVDQDASFPVEAAFSSNDENTSLSLGEDVSLALDMGGGVPAQVVGEDSMFSSTVGAALSDMPPDLNGDILDLGSLSASDSIEHSEGIRNNSIANAQGEMMMTSDTGNFNINASAPLDLGEPLDLGGGGMPSPSAIEPMDISSSFRGSSFPEGKEGDDSLLSPEASSAGVSAFRELERSVRVGYAGETLEDVIKGLLRPMLRTWLDNNLPRIVEELVDQEIQNMVGSARNPSGGKR